METSLPPCKALVVLFKVGPILHQNYPQPPKVPPAGLEPAIFGLEVRRLVH